MVILHDEQPHEAYLPTKARSRGLGQHRSLGASHVSPCLDLRATEPASPEAAPEVWHIAKGTSKLRQPSRALLTLPCTQHGVEAARAARARQRACGRRRTCWRRWSGWWRTRRRATRSCLASPATARRARRMRAAPRCCPAITARRARALPLACRLATSGALRPAALRVRALCQLWPPVELPKADRTEVCVLRVTTPSCQRCEGGGPRAHQCRVLR